MITELIVKDYSAMQNPFERVSAQGVALSNEIVVASTKMNGFMETVLRQLGTINTSFKS